MNYMEIHLFSLRFYTLSKGAGSLFLYHLEKAKDRGWNMMYNKEDGMLSGRYPIEIKSYF